MQTSTRLTTLAMAIVWSANLALAQQSVQRSTPKAVTSSTTTAAKPATAQTRTPVSTKMPSTASAENPAPVETRQAPVAQAETRSQPVARPAAVHTPGRYSSSSRHVYLNAGLGLATYYGGGLPLGVSVEVEAQNNFSIGGSVDYFHYNYGYYSGGYTFIYVGARASYHLSDALGVQNTSFDPYVGATLGFRHASYSDSYGYSYDGYSSGYNSSLYGGIHVGARYLFSPKVGGFAEVGYGVSALKLGLAVKF